MYSELVKKPYLGLWYHYHHYVVYQGEINNYSQVSWFLPYSDF